MSRKNASKFKIIPNKKPDESEQLPFFPKYETQHIFKENLRVTWFETDFSQSKYNFENKKSGSNACTLIAILTAAKCSFNHIAIDGPEKPINTKIIYALANGMLSGNAIHNALKARGALSNINLTVPEAIRHAGDKVPGIHEWKSELYPQPLALTLYDNLKRLWREWRFYCAIKKKNPDLYVVLICDSRSVLFILQEKTDTVTLIDSHQHSQEKGAFIATASRSRLKILCHWFSDLIYRCYRSYPHVYELALLYFKSRHKPRGKF